MNQLKTKKVLNANADSSFQVPENLGTVKVLLRMMAKVELFVLNVGGNMPMNKSASERAMRVAREIIPNSLVDLGNEEKVRGNWESVQTKIATHLEEAYREIEQWKSEYERLDRINDIHSETDRSCTEQLIKQHGQLAQKEREIERLKKELSDARMENTCVYGTSHPEIYKCVHESRLDIAREALEFVRDCDRRFQPPCDVCKDQAKQALEKLKEGS